MADTNIAAWVRGAAAVPVAPATPTTATLLPPTPPGPPVSPLALLYPDPGDGPVVHFPALEASVERLSTNRVVSPEEFRRIGAAARRNAFTITADLKQETLVEVRDLLAQNVADGASIRDFTAALEDRLPDLPLSEARVELVFRNNVNEAFAQGMEQVLTDPIVDDSFPYRQYDAIRDSRVREEHLALEVLGLNGTNIYHRDDPTWFKFRPPWDHNCRCGWGPVTIADAAADGVAHAKLWLRAIDAAQAGGEIVLAETVRPPLEFVDPPPFQPPVSFNRTAGAV